MNLFALRWQAKYLRISREALLVLSSLAMLLNLRLIMQLESEDAFTASMQVWKAPLEPFPPQPSQHAINKALAYYEIEVPAYVSAPKFDPDLEDRGRTTLHVGEKLEVTIGPSAFQSWGVLASTLAHEIEVHCKQNFIWIHLKDQLGFDATGEAEREAYRHEIAGRHRFGLTELEVYSIQNTMESYYPEDSRPSGWDLVSRNIKNQVDRLLAR